MQNNFLKIHDVIRDNLKSNPIINSVSYGDIYAEVLQKKHVNYPVAHFVINDVTVQDQFNTVSVDLMLLDIIDQSKSETETEAELHILNELLSVAESLHKELREGQLASENILAGDLNASAIRDVYNVALAGYDVSFDINFPNTITGCNI